MTDSPLTPYGEALEQIKQLEAQIAVLEMANINYSVNVCPELDRRIAELEALLSQVAWACWIADCNEELPDQIGGDLYDKLIDYLPPTLPGEEQEK